MTVKCKPDGYQTVIPYLVIKDVKKQLEFLMQAFDAKEIECMDLPDGSIGHAEVKIGDSIIMMGAAREDAQVVSSMNYLYLDDTDAYYKKALKAGAVSLMEPADQFYGDRNAGVKDPCGNQWWIATHIENLSKEELEKRAMEFFATKK